MKRSVANGDHVILKFHYRFIILVKSSNIAEATFVSFKGQVKGFNLLDRVWITKQMVKTGNYRAPPRVYYPWRSTQPLIAA